MNKSEQARCPKCGWNADIPGAWLGKQPNQINPETSACPKCGGQIEWEGVHRKQPQERTWEMWTLHEETIKEIARIKGLSLERRDLDEVARQVKKGIDAALDFVWEEVIRDAIRNTRQEGVEEEP